MNLWYNKMKRLFLGGENYSYLYSINNNYDDIWDIQSKNSKFQIC